MFVQIFLWDDITCFPVATCSLAVVLLVALSFPLGKVTGDQAWPDASRHLALAIPGMSLVRFLHQALKSIFKWKDMFLLCFCMTLSLKAIHILLCKSHLMFPQPKSHLLPRIPFQPEIQKAQARKSCSKNKSITSQIYLKWNNQPSNKTSQCQAVGKCCLQVWESRWEMGK